MMKRRVALKSMATTFGGLVMLPAWARGWSKASVVPVQPYLSPQQDELLAEIVDTIIPATDIPGAKALEVHTFVQKMVADCYEKEVQENLMKGISTVEEMAQQSYGQSFSTCNSTQRMDLLTKVETAIEPEQKEFYALVKELTIQGYMTSEYVMIHHMDYNMMPGHYHGCVPVTTQ